MRQTDWVTAGPLDVGMTDASTFVPDNTAPLPSVGSWVQTGSGTVEYFAYDPPPGGWELAEQDVAEVGGTDYQSHFPSLPAGTWASPTVPAPITIEWSSGATGTEGRVGQLNRVVNTYVGPPSDYLVNHWERYWTTLDLSLPSRWEWRNYLGPALYVDPLNPPELGTDGQYSFLEWGFDADKTIPIVPASAVLYFTNPTAPAGGTVTAWVVSGGVHGDYLANTDPSAGGWINVGSASAGDPITLDLTGVSWPAITSPPFGDYDNFHPDVWIALTYSDTSWVAASTLPAFLDPPTFGDASFYYDRVDVVCHFDDATLGYRWVGPVILEGGQPVSTSLSVGAWADTSTGTGWVLAAVEATVPPTVLHSEPWPFTGSSPSDVLAVTRPGGRNGGTINILLNGSPA